MHPPTVSRERSQGEAVSDAISSFNNLVLHPESDPGTRLITHESFMKAVQGRIIHIQDYLSGASPEISRDLLRLILLLKNETGCVPLIVGSRGNDLSLPGEKDIDIQWYDPTASVDPAHAFEKFLTSRTPIKNTKARNQIEAGCLLTPFRLDDVEDSKGPINRHFTLVTRTNLNDPLTIQSFKIAYAVQTGRNSPYVGWTENPTTSTPVVECGFPIDKTPAALYDPRQAHVGVIRNNDIAIIPTSSFHSKEIMAQIPDKPRVIMVVRQYTQTGQLPQVALPDLCDYTNPDDQYFWVFSLRRAVRKIEGSEYALGLLTNPEPRERLLPSIWPMALAILGENPHDREITAKYLIELSNKPVYRDLSSENKRPESLLHALLETRVFESLRGEKDAHSRTRNIMDNLYNLERNIEVSRRLQAARNQT
jgi:hypothetical protein